MIKDDLRKGDKVTYTDSLGNKEFGIVKSFNLHGEPFVVYHCAGNWELYENYTAALTDSNDLTLGWSK